MRVWARRQSAHVDLEHISERHLHPPTRHVHTDVSERQARAAKGMLLPNLYLPTRFNICTARHSPACNPHVQTEGGERLAERLGQNMALTHLDLSGNSLADAGLCLCFAARHDVSDSTSFGHIIPPRHLVLFRAQHPPALLHMQARTHMRTTALTFSNTSIVTRHHECPGLHYRLLTLCPAAY